MAQVDADSTQRLSDLISLRRSDDFLMEIDMKKILVRPRLVLRAVALCAAIAVLPAGLSAQVQSTPMKIGVIGSGNIGGTLGVLWAKAGHQVLFSSRHPDELVDLVKRAG